jgi:hypothetical protein
MRRLIIFSIGCLFSQSIYAQQNIEELNHKDRFIIAEALLFLDDYENDPFWRGLSAEGNIFTIVNDEALILNDIPAANSQVMVDIFGYWTSLNEVASKGLLIDLNPYAVEVTREYTGSITDVRGRVIIDAKKQITFRGYNGSTYIDELDQKFTLGFKLKKGIMIYEILGITSNSRETKGKYIVADLTTNGNNDEEFDPSFDSVVVEDDSNIQVFGDHLGKVVLSDFTEDSEIKFRSKSNLYHTTKKISGKLYNEVGSDGPNGFDNRIQLNFRKKRFSISPFASYDFRNFSNSQTAFNSQVNIGITQTNYGLSLGTRLLSKEDRFITLSIGGGNSLSNLTTNCTPFTSMFSQIDSDGDLYTRIVRVDQLEETGWISRGFGRLSLSVSKRWLEDLKGGIIFSGFVGTEFYQSSTYVYSSLANAKYSGLYGSEYFNILIDDPNHYQFGEYGVSLQDEAIVNSEAIVFSGLSLTKDLSKRIQMGLALGYTMVFGSPFHSEETLSIDFTEFQSIQEFDTALWNDRFRTSARLTYYL